MEGEILKTFSNLQDQDTGYSEWPLVQKAATGSRKKWEKVEGGRCLDFKMSVLLLCMEWLNDQMIAIEKKKKTNLLYSRFQEMRTDRGLQATQGSTGVIQEAEGRWTEPVLWFL